MIDVFDWSRLVRRDDGIWANPVGVEVSYPSDGHDRCLGVEESSFWFQHRNRCILAAVAQ